MNKFAEEEKKKPIIKDEYLHDEAFGSGDDEDFDDFSNDDLEGVGNFWDLPQGEWRYHVRRHRHNVDEWKKKNQQLPEEHRAAYPTTQPDPVYKGQRAWEGRDPEVGYRPISRLETEDQLKQGRSIHNIDPTTVSDRDSYFFLKRKDKADISGAHHLLAQMDHHPDQLCAGRGCMVKFITATPSIPGLRSEFSRDQNQYPNIGVVFHSHVEQDPIKYYVPDELLRKHHETCGDHLPNKNCAKTQRVVGYKPVTDTVPVYKNIPNPTPAPIISYTDHSKTEWDTDPDTGVRRITKMGPTVTGPDPHHPKTIQELSGTKEVPTSRTEPVFEDKSGECPFANHMRYCDKFHDEECTLRPQLQRVEGKPDIKLQVMPFKYSVEHGVYMPMESFGKDRLWQVSAHDVEHLDPRDQSWQPHNHNPFNHDDIESLARGSEAWRDLVTNLNEDWQSGRRVRVNPEAPRQIVRKWDPLDIPRIHNKEKPTTEHEEMDDEDLRGFGEEETFGGKTLESSRLKKSMKIGYTHVDESFVPSAPCRFCDDPSYTNGKGPVTQTSTAEDGRALYAHDECDDPFAFSNHFVSLESGDQLKCPNCGAECDTPGLCDQCSVSDAQKFTIQPNPVDSDFIPSRVFNSSAAPNSSLVVPTKVFKNPAVEQPEVDAETPTDVDNGNKNIQPF